MHAHRPTPGWGRVRPNRLASPHHGYFNRFYTTISTLEDMFRRADNRKPAVLSLLSVLGRGGGRKLTTMPNPTAQSPLNPNLDGDDRNPATLSHPCLGVGGGSTEIQPPCPTPTPGSQRVGCFYATFSTLGGGFRRGDDRKPAVLPLLAVLGEGGGRKPITTPNPTAQSPLNPNLDGGQPKKRPSCPIHI